MAATWQLYAAIILGIIALGIIGVFVYLLLYPQKNEFDRASGPLKKSSSKNTPSKTPSSSKKGGPAMPQRPSSQKRRGFFHHS